MKYKRISTTTMHPDVYGGKECNEHIPRWMGQFDEEEIGEIETIDFDAKLFPAGTKIYIEVPLCPKCGMEQELCECDFDWKEWVNYEYS